MELKNMTTNEYYKSKFTFCCWRYFRFFILHLFLQILYCYNCFRIFSSICGKILIKTIHFRLNVSVFCKLRLWRINVIKSISSSSFLSRFNLYLTGAQKSFDFNTLLVRNQYCFIDSKYSKQSQLQLLQRPRKDLFGSRSHLKKFFSS